MGAFRDRAIRVITTAGARQSRKAPDELHRHPLCALVCAFSAFYRLVLMACRWDYSTSIPELMQALDSLVKSNKVLYLGISDTPGKPSVCKSHV